MSTNKPSINPENMSILIVDDMKSMRLTIRKMLQNLNIGEKLRFAENGKQGLEILKSGPFDLAIIDWNMPIISGIAMLQEIRKTPEFRDMPVIMITAEAEREIVSEVAEIEIDGYLLKPLTLGSLEKKIKAVLKRIENPDPVKVHRKRARELEESGDYKGAIEEIKKALTYKSSASRLLRELGLLHFKIKKNSIAEKCLIKAVQSNKQDTISLVHLADYYLQIGKFEKAGSYYLDILSLSSRYNGKAFDIGKKLLIKGHRSLAVNIFSKALATAKKQSDIRDSIIDICLSHNEFEFPKILLENSIKENPSNYDMVYKAGLIALESGDWKAALDYFTKVDKHVRGHIDAKFNLAHIYFQNRKILKADDYLNQILRLEPKHEKALELRKNI